MDFLFLILDLTFGSSNSSSIPDDENSSSFLGVYFTFYCKFSSIILLSFFKGFLNLLSYYPFFMSLNRFLLNHFLLSSIPPSITFYSSLTISKDGLRWTSSSSSFSNYSHLSFSSSKSLFLCLLFVDSFYFSVLIYFFNF